MPGNSTDSCCHACCLLVAAAPVPPPCCPTHTFIDCLRTCPCLFAPCNPHRACAIPIQAVPPHRTIRNEFLAPPHLPGGAIVGPAGRPPLVYPPGARLFICPDARLCSLSESDPLRSRRRPPRPAPPRPVFPASAAGRPSPCWPVSTCPPPAALPARHFPARSFPIPILSHLCYYLQGIATKMRWSRQARGLHTQA